MLTRTLSILNMWKEVHIYLASYLSEPNFYNKEFKLYNIQISFDIIAIITRQVSNPRLSVLKAPVIWSMPTHVFENVFTR
jgi:hypothetical protein